MILLGVDPGTQFSGYSVFRKESTILSLLDYGVLKLGAQKPLPERVYKFHEEIDLLMNKNKIDYLVLETPFLGKNAQNFLKLGYLRGILYLLAQKHNIKITEFTPREVKQSVTGFGGASKEQVAFMIFRLIPKIEPSVRNDITDALAVGLCGVWKIGATKPPAVFY